MMVSRTGLEGLQIFFVSYARINRDRVLEKFIHRLRDEVIQRASGGRSLLRQRRHPNG